MRTTTSRRTVFARFSGVSGLIAAALAVSATPAARALESVQVGEGFTEPLFVTAPSGDARLFVVEKGGTIRIMQGGSVLSTPFLNLNVSGAAEGGLLGLAFDPYFSDSSKAGYGTFYVDYIHPTTGNTVVASYKVSATNPNVADQSTAKTVLTVTQPSGLTNHKAGWIGFRPGEADNLYIATGDGGSGNDPGNRAQNLNDNLGKILRVNVRSGAFPTNANRNYAIPVGNPFGKTPAGADIPGNDEIWAYGLRNPFRNSFDRRTGDLYIGDVGQGNREEIDFAAAGSAAGKNFGWRALEGMIRTPGNEGDPTPANATPPILDYGRSFGSTVIGGYVAHGGNLKELEGAYLFGDYGSGSIWAIRYQGSFIDIAQATDVTDIFNPVVDPQTGRRLIVALSSFGEDGFGHLYLVDIGSGKIFAMVPEPGTWALLLVSLVPVIVVARSRASQLRSGPEAA